MDWKNLPDVCLADDLFEGGPEGAARDLRSVALREPREWDLAWAEEVRDHLLALAETLSAAGSEAAQEWLAEAIEGTPWWDVFPFVWYYLLCLYAFGCWAMALEVSRAWCPLLAEAWPSWRGCPCWCFSGGTIAECCGREHCK